jgi:hypothetical protein
LCHYARIALAFARRAVHANEALVMASRTAGAWGFLKNGLQALPLETGHVYRIGRQPESELRLQSRSVSVEHSVIEVDAPMTPR